MLKDGRIKQQTAIKPAFAVLFYGTGKVSYGLVAKLFGVSPFAVQKWLKKETDAWPKSAISGHLQEIEFEERRRLA